MRTETLHRVVRLTARTSGVLFAAAQTASALDRRAGPALYRAFLVAHAVHFTVVARYAVATGGRRLFPGGRDLRDVGGWPALVAIYTGFAALALTGRKAVAVDPGQPRRGGAGPLAAGVIAAMFVATYLRLLPESRWFAAPATVIGAATVANIVRSRRREAPTRHP